MADDVQRLEASGTAIFVPNDEHVWVPATISSVLNDNTITYSLDRLDPPLSSAAGVSAGVSEDGTMGGGEITLDLSTLPPSVTSSGSDDSVGRFMGKLPLQDAGLSARNGAADMATLSSLNEPSILYNLRTRFFASIPYTYTADIVIAVNPYQWLHDLYTEEMRKEYLIFGHRGAEGIPPHVYSTSAQAFHGMKDFGRNQAILVSGESGAGKTETVKILMGHLAFVASADDQTVIRRVLESNPLLESFGNAKTVRNDNSSRFGKYIELQFSARQLLADHRLDSPGGSTAQQAEETAFLVGSCSRHYLLEKSRVVSQSTGERNFHVFYQLLAAPAMVSEPIALRSSSGEGLGPLAFNITVGGGEESITSKIEGLTDGARFDVTLRALDLIGLTNSDRRQMWELLAGIFHLGQLSFIPPSDGDADEGAELVPDDQTGPIVPSLAAAARLLGCGDVDALSVALLERTMSTVGETVKIKQRPAQAEEGRSSLAKELYSRLFGWLVQRINASTMVKDRNSADGDGASEAAIVRTIGLLDIFGFESFKTNRFEQLCINYANEKLQQKFTQDVFKSVQSEYEEEGITWQHISFAENQPVLDLIESRMGIVSILNEECVRPRGSDSAFCSKLITTHRSHPNFVTSKFNTANAVEFGVRHYAGAVTYSVEGFLEKNRDTLVDDLSKLMANSSNDLVKHLFTAGAPAAANDGGKGGSGKPSRRGGSTLTAATVATKFKRQLSSLMEAVGQTSVQYVRCVKPNSSKSQSMFQLPMVTEQLRCAGVLEAIRISRAAYPNRLPHEDILSRFGRLAAMTASDALAVERSGDEDLDGDEEDDMLGGQLRSSKRLAEQVTRVLGSLVPALENSDDAPYQVGKTRVYFQAGVLEGLEEQRQRIIQEYALQVQTAFRRYGPYRQYKAKRRVAFIGGSRFKARRERTRYVSILRRLVRIQATARRVAAVKRVRQMRLDAAAIRIQSWRRGVIVRRTQNLENKAAILIQAVLGRGPPARAKFLVDIVAFREHAKMENQLATLKEQLEAEKVAREAQEKADAERRKEQEEQRRRHREEQTQLLQAEIATLQDEVKDKAALVERIAILEAETTRLRADLESEKVAAQDAAVAAEERAQTMAETATANANAKAAAAAAVAAAASVPRDEADAVRAEAEELRRRVSELEHELVEKSASSPKMSVVSKDALTNGHDSEDEAATALEEEERQQQHQEELERVRLEEREVAEDRRNADLERLRQEERNMAEAKIKEAEAKCTAASNEEKEELRKSHAEALSAEKTAHSSIEAKLAEAVATHQRTMDEKERLTKQLKDRQTEAKAAMMEKEQLQRDLEENQNEVSRLKSKLSKEEEAEQRWMTMTDNLEAENKKFIKDKKSLEDENEQLKAQAKKYKEQIDSLQLQKQIQEQVKIQQRQQQQQQQQQQLKRAQEGSSTVVPSASPLKMASPVAALGKETLKEAMSSRANENQRQVATKPRPGSPRFSPGGVTGGVGKLIPPLNEFWEKVAFDALPETMGFSASAHSGYHIAEVHISSGKDYLVVDKDLTYVKWNVCSSKGGYPQSAAFRLHPVNGSSMKGRRSPDLPGDGSNLDFTLSTAIFKEVPKYVSTGNILKGFCLSLTEKPHEAAIFRFVRTRGPPPASAAEGVNALLAKGGFSSPMPMTNDPRVAAGAMNQMDESAFVFSIMNKRNFVHLRTDGFVDVAGSGASEKSPGGGKGLAGTTFSLEYLKPRESYEMTLHEEQLGLLVSKDLPLRILGFTAVVAPQGAARTGEAERSGRVHVGDVIMSADGYDLTVKSRKESIQIIMRSRPVVLGFRVGSNTGGRSPNGVGSGNSTYPMTAPSTLNKPMRRPSDLTESPVATLPQQPYSYSTPNSAQQRQAAMTPQTANLHAMVQHFQASPPQPPQGSPQRSLGQPRVVIGGSHLTSPQTFAGGLGGRANAPMVNGVVRRPSGENSAAGFEDLRLEAAQRFFSPAQLDQLRNVRDTIQRQSPGTFTQLGNLLNSSNSARCITMMEELIRKKYSPILPLFISNKESVVTILLARQ